MNNLHEASNALQVLVGLRLSSTSSAADMREFSFDSTHRNPESSIQVFLHIQCCWRVESSDRVITGNYDRYERFPESNEPLDEAWDPSQGGSLQEERLREWLTDRNTTKRVIENQSNGLIVSSAQVNLLGDVTIQLTGSFVVRLLPTSSTGEYWRIFQKGDPHFVFGSGGHEWHR